jgi:hypothetical protein
MLEEQGSWYDAGSRAVVRRAASDALALSRRAGDPAGIADALLHLFGFDTDENPERARALADEALQYARKAGDEVLVADALSLRALSFPIIEVDAEIAEIAALYRKIGDIHGLASLYNNAGYVALTQDSHERAAAYLDEALVLAERTGEPLRLMLAFGNLGLVSLFIADLERAEAPEGILGFAAIAASQGHDERAARLLGAAESMAIALDDEAGVKLEQEFFSPARQRLGEARWRAAYADGARLGYDEAVSLALEPA